MYATRNKSEELNKRSTSAFSTSEFTSFYVNNWAKINISHMVKYLVNMVDEAEHPINILKLLLKNAFFMD